jgi:hypothetical protein
MKNTLAVIVAVIGGSLVNIALVNMNGVLIALPEGADISSMDGLAASMRLFQPIHFLMPWLGHALGTFVGAFIAAKLVVTRKKIFAGVIGGFFLIGGIANAYIIPAPMWFIVVDLGFAYLPMAWLGGRIALGRSVAEL